MTLPGWQGGVFQLSKQCWREVTRSGSGGGDSPILPSTPVWNRDAPGGTGCHHPGPWPNGDTSQCHHPMPARIYLWRPVLWDLCLASLTQCQGCPGILLGAATPLSPQPHQIPHMEKAPVPSLPRGNSSPTREINPKSSGQRAGLGTGDAAPGGKLRLFLVLLAQSSLICSRLNCSGWKCSSRTGKSAELSCWCTQRLFHNHQHQLSEPGEPLGMWGAGGWAGISQEHLGLDTWTSP